LGQAKAEKTLADAEPQRINVGTHPDIPDEKAASPMATTVLASRQPPDGLDWPHRRLDRNFWQLDPQILLAAGREAAFMPEDGNSKGRE